MPKARAIFCSARKPNKEQALPAIFYWHIISTQSPEAFLAATGPMKPTPKRIAFPFAYIKISRTLQKHNYQSLTLCTKKKHKTFHEQMTIKARQQENCNQKFLSNQWLARRVFEKEHLPLNYSLRTYAHTHTHTPNWISISPRQYFLILKM